MKAKSLTSIALMASLISVLGPLTIPLGPIPLSFASLAIYLSLYILGRKEGTISLIIYILLGLIGLPIFSGFGAGLAKVLGPTGGFILGYLPMALLSGYFIDAYKDSPYKQFLGLVIGLLILYLFGSLWLAFQADLSIKAAMALAVFPFIPGDLIKILLALYLGPSIEKKVKLGS